MSAAEERTIVKKLRQFASLVLTVAMAVSLCACGGTKKAETKKLKVGISWSEDNLDTAKDDYCNAVIKAGGEPVYLAQFKTEEEVVAMANDSEYGLGGAVWTRDINRAMRVARGIETGRIWINTYNAIPAGAPFGGVKTSGVGRETHKVILEHYTQMKNIFINLKEEPSGFYPA